jgi:serine-type D-Ala-D-Ala carboxypeptidase/endopeptidase (penicillin-binding protein 4)
MRALLALTLTVALSAAELASRFEQIINAPALAHAFVGIELVRLGDGRVLYSHNSERLFLPASNMKLFTTALALSKLGPDYRLTTQMGAQVPIDPAGTLAGDLEFIGGGDPSLSGREYPYRKSAAPGAVYTFSAIEELADQLIARGLKRVDGDVVGDDTRYVWEPQPGGWSSNSATEEYGAPVSALILHDNSFALTLHPAAHAGGLARITLSPPFENFVIDNRVVTTERGERKIEVYRSASGRELHLWGTIPKRDAGYTQELAIGDPALYAAEVLRDALARRGVAIRGTAVERHRFPDESSVVAAPKLEAALAEHLSPPLIDLLQVVDKVSQNLHAEVLLREVGVAAGRGGSREDGLAAMNDFLAGIGVSKADHVFTDGSGLSRATLVTPQAITKLLAAMNESKVPRPVVQSAAHRRRGWNAGRSIRSASGSSRDSRQDGHARSRSRAFRLRRHAAQWSRGVFVRGEQFRGAGSGGYGDPGSTGAGAAEVIQSANRKGLTGPNVLQRLRDLIRQGQQVFNLIRSGAHDDDPEIAATEVLLVRQSLIYGHEHLVAGNFGSLQQVAVLSAFQARPFNGMDFMLRKGVPEAERQTLIQQNLHAILASNDSLASSSA